MAHSTNVQSTLSYFRNPAIVSSNIHFIEEDKVSLLKDHAIAGTGAGVVAVLCMHPLDLLKIKFQVSTSKPEKGVGSRIYTSLRDIYQTRGVKGLYRGVGPNIAGNASSWGLYFLL